MACRSLALALHRGQWSRVACLMQLLNLAIDARPSSASHLSTAGAASLALGALRQCPGDSAAGPGLHTTALALLLRLLRCDERTAEHLLSPDALALVLSTLLPHTPAAPHPSYTPTPAGPAGEGRAQLAARRSAAAIVHHLARDGRAAKEALVEVGTLSVLLGVLRDLPCMCDLTLAQVCGVQGLMPHRHCQP